MNQKLSKIIDVSGKCSLAWFVYETYKYIFAGRMLTEINQIPLTFQSGATFLGIYSVCRIPVAAIGVFFLAFLILRGNIIGLIVGLAYWVMGNLINPFWFFMSYEMQVTPVGKATKLLLFANYFWAGIVLIILVSFYFHRRSLGYIKEESIE